MKIVWKKSYYEWKDPFRISDKEITMAFETDCKFCHDDFITYNPNELYCSLACEDAAENKAAEEAKYK